jgi:predicted nucleic acid-binding protein
LIEESLVLDASVIAKWYNKEQYSDRALRFMNGYIEGVLTLSEPIIVLYEVSNAIYKNPQLEASDALKAIKSLMSLLKDVVETPSSMDLWETMRLARMVKTSFYDASYIYHAKKCNLKLVTADDDMSRKAMGIVEVIHLKEID